MLIPAGELQGILRYESVATVKTLLAMACMHKTRAEPLQHRGGFDAKHVPE
jgi:hypothetical protein